MKKWLKNSFVLMAATLSLTTPLLGEGLLGGFFSPCCNNGPLNCGALSVELKGGVTPTHYSGRGDTYVTIPVLTPPVVNIGRGPKFDDQFNTPWQIGVELGWNASTNVQLFLEYVYNHASSKSDSFDIAQTRFGRRFDDFKTNSLYLGTKYYFNNIWCSPCMGSVAPFIGFKGGFVWHERVRSSLRVGGTTITSYTHYDNESALSAGLQLGVEWFYNCHLSVALTGEVVGTQPHRSNRHVNLTNIPVFEELGVTSINCGHTGKLISYPVTLGVRYTF